MCPQVSINSISDKDIVLWPLYPRAGAKRSGNQKIFNRKYAKKKLKLFFRLNKVKMFNIYVFIVLRQWMHNINNGKEDTRVQNKGILFAPPFPNSEHRWYTHFSARIYLWSLIYEYTGVLEENLLKKFILHTENACNFHHILQTTESFGNTI